MQIKGFEFPDDLYYDKLHGWARVEDNVVTQGMTDFGQKIAHEIVFVEMPRVGRAVTQGDTLLSVESGKWVGRMPALVSGKVIEGNEELEWEPGKINTSPYDEGWFVKIEMSNPAELDNLMKAGSPELQAFIEGEVEKYKDVLD